MSVTVLALKTIKFLIPDANEWELVEPPFGEGVVRTITRLRFDNHDTSSHTPTIYVRESDLSKITTEKPELWRVHIPRLIAAGGEDEDCGVVTILESGQSLSVQLAAAPSDVNDSNKWPAMTVNYVDQLVTQTAPSQLTADNTDLLRTFEAVTLGRIT